VALDTVLEAEGCFVGRRLSHKQSVDVVGCPTTLRRIAELDDAGGGETGPDLVRATLRFTRQAWPETPESTQAEVLMGVAYFLRQWSTTANFNREAAVARAAGMKPEELLDRARGLKHSNKKPMLLAEAMAQILQQVYDEQRRGRRLIGRPEDNR
jgi:hypothetical protein